MTKPPELQIRRAGTSDLDGVASVWHQSASTMDDTIPDMPGRDDLRRRIDAELRSGWDLYVALWDERIVGMLALKPAAAVLDQIFVAPSKQGKGVGRALLDVAKQLMASGFTLRMASANDRARRFYEAEGMKMLGEGTHPSTGRPVLFYGWNVD